MLLTFAVLGAVSGSANLAMAQDQRAETHGGDASSSQAKLDAQCAHRRVMPPDPRDECARRGRSNVQLGYGQDGGYASGYGTGPGNTGGQGNSIGPGNAGAQGNSIGPGNAGGQGNSIGPGTGGGGGQGKGRR
jgi:hypothetical protein